MASQILTAWARSMMELATVTQLITVGATLCGVVLTLVTNAYLERRKVRDAHRLESLRLAAEHTKWLRDERMKAYAGFSLAGEEILQFLRSEMPKLLEPGGLGRDVTEARWRELRTELRKAYNQVSLFGAEEPRAVGLQLWQVARNGGNDFLRDVFASSDTHTVQHDLSDQIPSVVSQLGTIGDRFLNACRKDLQGDNRLGDGSVPP